MRKVLIARATGSDGEPAVEAIVVFENVLPTYNDHRAQESAIEKVYREAFNERPVHIGSATLPWLPADEERFDGN
jgi:hypothetical protein